MIAEDLSRRVLEACRARDLRLATVESCTGGLVIAALTDIAGSSDVVECGFITYSNAAKMRLVGVAEEILARYGAVSRQTAIAMAEGGLRNSSADIALSTTGIAGPGGGTAQKPVGLVHMAAALRGAPTLHYEARFDPSWTRGQIRLAAARRALQLALERLGEV